MRLFMSGEAYWHGRSQETRWNLKKVPKVENRDPKRLCWRTVLEEVRQKARKTHFEGPPRRTRGER